MCGHENEPTVAAAGSQFGGDATDARHRIISGLAALPSPERVHLGSLGVPRTPGAWSRLGALTPRRRVNSRGRYVSTTSDDTTHVKTWPTYNAAQVHGQEQVAKALSALCSLIQQPVQERGRPRIPLADAIFCAAMKVYSGTSARRAMTDMRQYEAKGLILRALHYNSIFTVFEDPSVTPILKRLVEYSATPLRDIENDFAADSTGFATRVYGRWIDAKYGPHPRRKLCGWVMAHLMVGVNTKNITAIEVTAPSVHDATQFMALLDRTARTFQMREVSADKAYLSNAIVGAVADIGAQPYIPFHSNCNGRMGGALWRKIFRDFRERPDEFYDHYHRRSNVESAFSMIKAKFGGFVRSKTATVQVN